MEEIFGSKIFSCIHSTLSLYIQSMSKPDSWVHYYIGLLKVKPPHFSFNETQKDFEQKLITVVDIIELAHLYCKISNPKTYESEPHKIHSENRDYIIKNISGLGQKQFLELKQILRTTVMFEAN